ncbi:MAG: AAA family ATPase [Scytonematopsis contorta HA4267-MV1]|jgi:predicted ATPase/signal transduction histidine kinase|nr:AAA family ATPase [Scytonematopsis contorta HA4267-MV1]
MIALPGYRLGKILYSGEKTIVYRCLRESDHQSLIIKTLKADFPRVEETARLRQEYQILTDLPLPGVVKTYGLEQYQQRLALVLEDFGGESLQAFVAEKTLLLEDFLNFAIKISSILGEIHHHQIIHKDIKLKNILINPQQEIKIIDFSIASRLLKENPYLNAPNLLEGSLPYISPEQTGRTNRVVDYRSDLYALGVTFYELLVGHLPFQSNDPLELIHCHIAKQPIPPHQVRQNIPVVVSNIVMKLLAKNAEDRYQSAFGVKTDLEACLAQLTATGKIEEFTIAQHDTSGYLLIPQKLYGREAEVEILMQAFNRVAGVENAKSKVEMLFVSGYSGVGKSCLVQQIHKPILLARGYFIAGKFDQFKRDIPYSSLIEAFRLLVQQLLAESDTNLEIWKAKIQSALGKNGQVIVDVIPEVELILGKQTPLPTLAASEAQVRFNRVFQAFVRVFAQPQHPLVLFLDDLQWADFASLKFIQTLMSDSNSGYLLILGAYRNNEVNAAHPLTQCIAQLQDSGAIVNHIVLQPLSLENVKQLVADTLQEAENSQLLATVLYKKTDGNPFFLTQLLQSLAQINLIRFDFTIGRWFWDLKQIETLGVTDNVIELMIGKIQKLPINTQTLLKFAACIGHCFDLETLAVISNKSVPTTASEIWLAMKAGLILPLCNAYKIPLVVGEETVATVLKESAIRYRFLHDRVQQAAYSLIPEAERKATHLKIGKRLQKRLSADEQKENIFELVNQLNYAKDLITEQQEKNQLAALNLIAGQKAKSAIAYEPSTNYLNLGLELLADNSWQTNYELTLSLYESAIDVECINANYARCQSLINLALQQVKTLLDRVRIYKQKINLEIARADSLGSIQTALNVLELLDIHIPTDSLEIENYNTRLRQELSFQPGEVAVLANLPLMKDANKRAAMEILNTMPGPVYIAKPQLFMPLMLTMTRLSVEYGNWIPSSFAYCAFGLVCANVFDQSETGYEFGLLSLKALEKFNDKTLVPRVLKVYGSHIHLIKNSLRSTLEFLQSSIERSIEVGNLEFIGYGASEYVMYSFFCGDNLEIINQKALPYVELVDWAKQELGIYYIRIARQVVLNFIGQTENILILTGESFDEATMLSIVEAANWQTLLFCFYLFKMMLAYHFGDYDQALIQAESTARNLEAVVGMMMIFEYYYYHSLILLARCHQLNNSDYEELQVFQQIEANQAILRKKAEYAPINFQHKYELVEAEIARVKGQTLLAMDMYDKSIQSAKNNQYIQDEALANELAAKFYLTINKPKIATAYLNHAYLAYTSWGSAAKAQDLLTRYPDLLTPQTNLSLNNISISSSLNSTAWLDLSTVVKASQAIASELVRKNLLNRLIAIVVENAAAEQGFLITEALEGFTVVAAATIDNNQIISLSSFDEIPLPLTILSYVFRTRESVILNDATHESTFNKDPYIVVNQPKSVLCVPIIHQGKIKNLLYLENNLTTGAFTVERLEILKLLSAQIAVSLENAQLYENLTQTNAELAAANTQLEQYTQTLEATVTERTLELQQKNNSLEKMTTRLTLINGELESFSSSVSHDLRSPLRRIDQFTQMLLNSANSSLSAESEDYLNRIKASSQHMRQLIEDLLRLSRISRSELHRTTVDVSAMVQTLVQDLQKEQPRQAEFIITPNLTASADANLLRAALENLLANAWKYTRSRDCTQIEFGQINNGQLSSGVFFIRDNGVGFDMKDSNKLFQPFQRLHSATEFEGSGIGLATVKRIIHRHCGKIWAESRVGEGAVFYFTLEG